MKHSRNISLVILFISLSFSILNAQAKIQKIGFAFSGGGAKGIAQVGALKVLEEEGIFPDFITGTSIGSIVGGLYALGYTAADLEEMAQTLDWEDYFTDHHDRSYLSIEEKSQADRYILSFPYENGKIQLPKGLVKGQKMGLLLSRLTVSAHHIRDFDDFKIPFRCVATDLENGEAVTLGEGSLADAIRASISIPTVFTPQEIDGKLLVDGGVARNLPVQDVIDMGADIVIGFDVGANLYKKEEISSLVTVLEQTGSFKNAEANVIQGGLADIIIKPDLHDISALTFDKIDVLLQRGEEAARAMLPKIREVFANVPTKKYVPIPLKRDSFNIQGIDYEGVTEKGKDILKSLFQTNFPKIHSLNSIEEKLKSVYTTRFFNKIDYRLMPVGDGGHILLIRAQQQSGDYVKLSASYDNDYNAAILLNATLRNKLFNRSKLSIDLRISENPALFAEYLIYTRQRPNLGFKLNASANFYPGSFYDQFELKSDFNLRHMVAKAEVFSGLSKRASLSLGYGVEYLGQNEIFNSTFSDNAQLKSQNLYLHINRDTYNRFYFPTKGSILSLNGKLILDGVIDKKGSNNITSDVDYSYVLDGQFSLALPLNDQFTFQWYNYGGYMNFKNENNFVNLFYLGRRLPRENNNFPFYGLRYMELPVNQFAYSGLKFQYEPWTNYFISLAFNYGWYKADTFSFVDDDEIQIYNSWEDQIGGLGLELGMLTRVGPVRFTTEYNLDAKRFNLTFLLGYQI